MRHLRCFVFCRPAVAALLLAMALAVRAIVPAGFMPVSTTTGIEIAVCSGQGPMQIVIGTDGIPRPADHHPANDTSAHCPFAATGLALLSPISPELLLAALLFALVLALAPAAVPRIIDTARRRPPLRAPPLAR